MTKQRIKNKKVVSLPKLNFVTTRRHIKMIHFHVELEQLLINTGRVERDGHFAVCPC